MYTYTVGTVDKEPVGQELNKELVGKETDKELLF